MKLMKKLGLTLSAVAFCLSMFVLTSNAQYGNDRRWENNRRDRSGSSRVHQNRGYQRNRRVTPREYYRLSRQRSRLYRSRERYQRNDGYINKRESQRLERQRDRYRRNVRRDRRDW